MATTSSNKQNTEIGEPYDLTQDRTRDQDYLNNLMKDIGINEENFVEGVTEISDERNRFEVTELRRHLQLEYGAEVYDRDLQKILSISTNQRNYLTGAFEAQRDFDQWEYELNI